MKTYFHRLYQPDRIVISVAGNAAHTDVIDRVGPAFESIKPGNGIAERITPQSRSHVEVHDKDLEQVHICLGAPGLSITDPRRYAYSLLNTILGGNMSSRLFQEIREKRGLAYTVYSFVASHVDTGMFGIYLAVDPTRAFEATDLVLNVVGKLGAEPVTATELQGAVEYTKGNLLLASESNDNQMVRSAQNEIHFNRIIRLPEIIKKIESVSAAEILELSKTLFTKNKMSLTLLGPVKNKKPFEEMLYN
jgi:predicted Zn-dependent peptidase